MGYFLDINSINISIGGVLMALSAVMFMIPIPDDIRWKNLRSGRATLAIAYIILGMLMVVNGVTGAERGELSGMITLIIAFFQALLYTRICILFLKPRSSDSPRLRPLLAACCVLCACMVAFYIMKPGLFPLVFHIGIALYALLLTYCCILFIRTYNATVKHLEYVYDENMYYRLRWVKRCFYSALMVGIMAWFMAFFNRAMTLNISGIFIYTIYYLCMVGYLMKYVSNYGFILKSDENETAHTAEEVCLMNERQLEESLEEWVRDKKYRNCSKKVEDIVEELGTTRINLNEHLNRRFGMTFRSWRNHLRIEEAKRLINDNKIPLPDIYSAVGFSDRSNFHREFKEIVGMTPKQYRERHDL